MLIGSLLHADPTLRHRVIASLNKLRTVHPEVKLDPAAVELLLAAEIVGHYRSYQVLGPLQERLRPGDQVLAGDGQLDGAGARANLPSDGAPPPARRSARCLRGTPLVESRRSAEMRSSSWTTFSSQSSGSCSFRCSTAALRSPSGSRSRTVSWALRSKRPSRRWRRSWPARIHGCGPARSMRLARCSWKGSRARSIGSRRTRIRQCKQAVEKARRRLAGISDAAAIPVPVPPTMGVGIGSG